MKSIKRIYEKYYQIKADREISISQLKKEMGSMFHSIVLYGAGSAGIAFLHYLNDVDIFPLCFSDGDETKWNTICEGLEVIPPREITKRAGEDCLVILTINTDGKNYCKSFAEALRKGGAAAVHKRLHDLGCKNIVEYTFCRRCFELFSGEKYNLPSCSDVYLMEKHRSELEQVEKWLGDSLSKETFQKIVEFRMLDDTIAVPTFNQEEEYFAYDVYRAVDNEIFVDGGAYSGTTLDIFLKNNAGKMDGYYAIEPDSYSYRALLENLNKKEDTIKNKVYAFQAAAYDTTAKEVPFCSLKSPGSFVSQIGADRVMTLKIDDMLYGKDCSFIKMNIEGSEIPALKGAEHTIRRCGPVLAIMGYHRTRDLWEIPHIIMGMNPLYRLYLRSYMNHISFVFYAVPEERVLT